MKALGVVVVIHAVESAHPGVGRIIYARAAILAALFGLAGIDPSWAYVGNSFIKVPGLSGDWQGADHKHWARVDANYWPNGRPIGLSGAGMRNPDQFSGPVSPRQGEGTLVIALDKDSSVLPQLMDRCVQKTPITEVTYAESSDRARTTFEIGARPAQIPAYYEYRLKNVVFSDCPVVPGAP